VSRPGPLPGSEAKPAPTGILDRLRDRAASPDEPTDPKVAAQEARAKLIVLLAATSDPDEVRSYTQAIVALEKIAPSDEPAAEEHEPLDLSFLCDRCLSCMLENTADPAEREKVRRENIAHHEREQAQHDRDRQVAGVLSWLIDHGRGGAGPQDMIRMLEKHGYRLDPEMRAVIEARQFRHADRGGFR
jgi:hypothetical protein